MLTTCRPPGTDKRRRVLLSVYACEPDRGSEPDIGWQWALAYRDVAEVWALTRANNRAVIEAWESVHGRTGVHWIWVDGPAWMLKVKKRLGRPGILIYYWLWQFFAGKAAVAAERADGPFDWAHHITTNGFREPGRLDWLKSPVVWGPIGGLQNSDWSLSRLRSRKAACMELLRTVVNNVTKITGIRSIRAVKNRVLVMGANDESMKWIRTWRKTGPSFQLIEIGAPVVVTEASDVQRSQWDILWAGNDESRKNPEFALLAWDRLRRGDSRFQLVMIGLSANRQKELHRWADRAGIDIREGVRMIHWVSLAELAEHYRIAGQFWFTSYRDTSGTVALWALAYGIPCLAFNHQGAAVMLADHRGVLIDGGRMEARLKNWCDEALRVSLRALNSFTPDRPFDSPQIEWAPKPHLVAAAMDQHLNVPSTQG